MLAAKTVAYSIENRNRLWIQACRLKNSKQPLRMSKMTIG